MPVARSSARINPATTNGRSSFSAFFFSLYRRSRSRFAAFPWYAGSYAIGVAAGLRGDGWNLGFVVETERRFYLANAVEHTVHTDGGRTRVELLMTDAQLARAFVVPSRVLKDPEVEGVMRTDKDGRKKVSVSIRTNSKQERLYAFVLGLIEGES